MSHVRKDTLKRCIEWAKHLRPYGKRVQAKRERGAAKDQIRKEQKYVVGRNRVRWCIVSFVSRIETHRIYHMELVVGNSTALDWVSCCYFVCSFDCSNCSND